MSKVKIDWFNHLFEFVTVVVGILLAFGLNSWNENRKEKIQAEQFLKGIIAEIKENKELTASRLAYHLDLMKQIKEVPKEANMVLKIPLLKSYAWEMANKNLLRKHIDFELFRLLTEIYQVQKGLTRTAMNAGGLMDQLNVIGPAMLAGVDKRNFDPVEYMADVKSGWYSIFEDVTYFEDSLLKLYEKILESENQISK